MEHHESWKDQLKPFEMSDLLSWIDMEKLNPMAFIGAIFGGSQSGGVDTKDVATSLIDRTVKAGEGTDVYKARPEAYTGSGDESMYTGGISAMINQEYGDYAATKVTQQFLYDIEKG